MQIFFFAAAFPQLLKLLNTCVVKSARMAVSEFFFQIRYISHAMPISFQFSRENAPLGGFCEQSVEKLLVSCGKKKKARRKKKQKRRNKENYLFIFLYMFRKNSSEGKKKKFNAVQLLNKLYSKIRVTWCTAWSRKKFIPWRDMFVTRYIYPHLVGRKFYTWRT